MDLKEIAGDACTHGLYVSEVEEKYQTYYIGYLITKGRQELIDIEFNSEDVDQAIDEIEL